MSTPLSETLAHLGLYERAFVGKTRSIKNAFMEKYLKGTSCDPLASGYGFFIEPYYPLALSDARDFGVYQRLTDSSDPLELTISYGVIYFFIADQDHLISYSIDYRTQSQQLVYSLSAKGAEKELQIDDQPFSLKALNAVLTAYESLLDKLL